MPDAEGEEFVLENEWDVAVPVNFETVDGRLRVSYFPSVEHKITAWLSAHKSDPFSLDALAALWHALAPDAKKHGYRAERGRERWGYILQALPDGLNTSCIQDSTRRLSAADEDFNKTSYDIEMTVEDGRIACGTEVNGKIVSVAVTHFEPQAGKAAEVGVETCKGFRGNGYATSNLVALTEELFKLGARAEYRCYHDNEASLKTALKAGFCECGKYYYYVLRRAVRKTAGEERG